jgi:hypothetical protein
MEFMSRGWRKSGSHVTGLVLLLVLLPGLIMPAGKLILPESDSCSMEACDLQGFCCCKSRYSHARGEHDSSSPGFSAGTTIQGPAQCALLPSASPSIVKQTPLASTVHWEFAGIHCRPHERAERPVSTVSLPSNSSRAPPAI